ncbi:MAG: 3'-5' exonuclease [Patulibacter sp.]
MRRAAIRRWAFVDTETTGLNPARDRLTEAAAIVCDGQLAVVERFAWTQDEGGDALTAWAKRLVGLLGDGVLVAHNLHFDLAFLEAVPELAATGVAHPPRWLCTLNLAGRRSLGDLAEALKVDVSAPHTAMGDALTLASAVRALERLAEDRQVDTVAGLAVVAPIRRRAVAQVSTGPWQSLVDGLEHVVPVTPVTKSQRQLVASLAADGVWNPTPAGVDDAIRAARAIGLVRIQALRALEELGVATGIEGWHDAVPR